MDKQLIIDGLLFNMTFKHLEKGQYSILVSKFNGRSVGEIKVDIINFDAKLEFDSKDLNRIKEHISSNKLLYLGYFKAALCPSPSLN